MNLLYAGILTVSAAAAGATSWMTWRRRLSPGATSLSVAMAAMSVWAGTYAIRWLSVEPAAIHFWLDMTYVGVVIEPAAMFLFALAVAGKRPRISRRHVALLSIVPALTLTILWTDPLHGLFYGGSRPSGAIFGGGPWFWVNVAYTYTLIMVTLGLTFRTYLRAPRVFKRQIGAVLLALLLPTAVNVMSFLGLVPSSELDLTPLLFTISGVIIATALYRYRLFDVAPIARDFIVENMTDGIVVLDAGSRVVDFNRAAAEYTGIGSEALGELAHEVLPDWAMTSCDLSGGELAHEVLLPENHEVFALEVRCIPLSLNDGATASITSMRDVSGRRRAEMELAEYREELELLAVTDELTGLANRRKALERLAEEYPRFLRTGAPLAVISLDIDHFKNVNDTYGHGAGDLVLASFGEVLSSAVRSYDLAARVGGEEFLVIAPATSLDEATALAERIRAAIEDARIRVGDLSLSITASLGVSVAATTDHGTDPLLKRADSALYAAKAAGRNRVIVAPADAHASTAVRDS